MKAKTKFIKMMVLLTFIGIQSTATAQQFNQKFDTKNHSKAKGVWAQVSYPEGWTKKESPTPNLVQIIVGKHEGIELQLHIQVREVEGDLEKQCNRLSASEWNDAGQIKTSNTVGVATNSVKTLVQKKPSFTSDITVQQADLNMAAKQLAICHQKTMIILMCASFISDGSLQKAKDNIAKSDDFCKQYLNSFVLMEK